jgi:hypothetical protein
LLTRLSSVWMVEGAVVNLWKADLLQTLLTRRLARDYTIYLPAGMSSVFWRL